MIQWLADVDQETTEKMPDGKRAHIHLYAGSALSDNSAEIELCRLDAKATGAFPRAFESVGEEERSVAYPEWFVDLED